MRPIIVEDGIELGEFSPEIDLDVVFFISYYYEIHGFIPSC